MTFGHDCNHGDSCVPVSRQRTAEKERAHSARSVACQVPGVWAHTYDRAQGAALRRKIQRLGGGRLPRPDEHPRDQTHLRHLLPDPDDLGGGKSGGTSRL